MLHVLPVNFGDRLDRSYTACDKYGVDPQCMCLSQTTW